MTSKDQAIKQIDEVLTQYQTLRSRSQYDDCSDQGATATTALVMAMSATISQLAPKDSQYTETLRNLLKRYGEDSAVNIPHLVGVLAVLRDAYDKGYLRTIEEFVHADLFSDFLEMAEYLLAEGYKDPAAVIAGSVLEEHLRKLCQLNGITILDGGKTKKADTMNADLAGKNVYTKLDQKSITAWLDLRNKAAHGKYGEYSREQVDLMLRGIRNFLSRIPA